VAAFVGLTNAGGAWAFSDVPSDRHDYVAVTGLAVKGAVQGFPDGTFRPDALVSRAQFVKMIAAAVFLPLRESDRTPFGDLSDSVPRPSYPDSYVAAAYMAGIVEGKSAGIFDPDAPLIRVQAMTIAVRASLKLQARELKPLPTGYGGRFADLDDPIHGENAKLAEANHLLAGIDLLGWDPWAPATRSEAALIAWNVVNCFG
jgi:hypothetical protein